MLRHSLAVLALVAAQAASAGAQTTAVLLRSGTTAAKKDLVIIGDGFQAGADQTTFNTFVNTFVMTGVFGEGPFWEDMNAFNIYRINADSADSGVTQVDATGAVTVDRDTALDYRYSGIWDRCWMEPGPDTGTRLNAILNAQTPGWDYVFVVLNEPGFGGCAGGTRLAVTLAGNWSVGSHEMGHMVGGLADEYCRAGTWTGGEPGQVNVTANTDRATLKWRAFVNPSTPVPTGINANPGNGACTGYNQGGGPPAGWSNDDDAGLFEGAKYNDSGIYRPVVNCRMRGNAPHFCPVCYNRIKENLDPFHDYTYQRAYAGDFTGDGRADVVTHNGNSLALYESVGLEVEPRWVATGAIPVWDDFKPGDKFYVGDFDHDGRDDLYVFNATDWAIPYFAMLRSTGAGFECIRRFDLELPGWDDMRLHDTFQVADFDGDGRDDVYVFNGTDWSVGYLEMLRSTGTTLSYVRRYDRDLPGWGRMESHDQFYVADIDADRKQDLYVFNGRDWAIGYLQLLGSTGSALRHIRRYDEELPGWDDMRTHDQFFVGDFNADGRDDLYVFNGSDWSMEYLEMLRSTGTAMANSHRFDGTVPGWDGLAPHDRFFVADVDGDKRKDLYIYNSADWATEYLGTLRSTGTSLAGGWQSNWIGSWNLGPPDLFLIGNFNGPTGGDDLFVRNENWFGMLRSFSASVGLTAIHPKWIHRHRYHNLGWW
jgi:hypothetical protein